MSGGPFLTPSTGTGSGSTVPTWTRLNSLEGASLIQAGTPATSAFTFDSGTERFSITWANTVIESDGYAEGDRFLIPLAAINPSFNMSTYSLELYINEVTAFPTAGNQNQVVWGLVTSNNGISPVGSCVGLCNTSAGVRTLRYVLANSPNVAIGTTVINGVGKYHSFHTGLGNRAPASFSYLNNVSTWSSALSGSTDSHSLVDPAYILISAGKDSGTTNANGDTFTFELWYKIINRGSLLS